MNIRNDLLGRSGLIVTLFATAMPITAYAQTGQNTPTPSTAVASKQTTAVSQNGDAQTLTDIVVTAERRTSSEQKTAASITVQRGADLLARGKFTLQSILETVPGVSGGESTGQTNEPTGSDSPASGVTIRGISSNGSPAGVTLSGIPATALYVDDVYSGIGGAYDIDRVEVLRGPQGTLYGRSATAGLVAIHTRNPDLEQTEAWGSVEGGNLGLFHLSGALNVPIIDNTLSVRISGNHYERDGADVDRGYGASRVNEGRIKVLYKPNDDISLLVGGAFQDNTLLNGGIKGVLSQPDHVTYEAFPSGSASTKYRQVWAEINWSLGGVRLTYLPSYRTWDQDAKVIVVGPGGGTLNSLVRTPTDDFVTHELRLTSDTSSIFQWQTGLFYYFNDIRSSNSNIWQESKGLLFEADVRRRTQDVGVFAEGTIRLAEGLRATLGARYDKTVVKTEETYTSNLNVFCNTPLGFVTQCATAAADSPQAGLPEQLTSITINGDTGRRSFENVTYKARLEYDLTPTSLLYGSVTTGFLPGDVQIGTGAGNVPAVFPYQSERLTAYEIGSKNRFLDQRLQLNVGVFHYTYGGYQTSIQTDPSNPASAILFNVPLRMTGVEADGAIKLTAHDRLGANFTHIASKFHDLPDGFADAVQQRSLWGFSPTTGTVFYDHDFRLSGGSSVTLHGEGIWRSGYDVTYTSPALAAQGGLPFVHQDSFFLGNLNLTWTSAGDRLSLTGYLRNATNTRFKTYVNLQSITPLQATANQSDGRTYGAVLTARF